MSNDQSNDHMAERLRQVGSLTGGFVRRPVRTDAVAEDAPPVTLVPVPRRSRVFLRNGEGHGAFADLTLTAPISRSSPA